MDIIKCKNKICLRMKIWIVCAVSVFSFTSCSIPGFSDSSNSDDTSINSTIETSSASSSDIDSSLTISESRIDSNSSGSAQAEYKVGDAVYKGETKDGYAHGNGSYQSEKYSLEGVFEKNKLTSGVIVINNNSSSIQLEVKDSQVSYKDVKISFKNGDMYTGDWNKSITGNGVLTYSNGDMYEGDFKDGVRNGTGTYTWSNGAKYKGLWKNDKMNGQGVYYYPDQNRSLTGSFINDVPDGTMEYEYKNHKYKAIWSNGKCNSIKY